MNLNSKAKKTLQSILVAFFIVFFSSSIKTVFQVFFILMAESFDRTRGSFAVSASVFMIVFGTASPIVGFLADRLGPKRVLVAGLQTAGIALLGCAVLSSYGAFVFLYGIAASFALAAMAYVPTGILVDRTIPEKYTGIVYATLTSGAAIGFIVLSPVWVFAQEYLHWRQVFFATGLTFLLPLQILAICYLPDLQSKQPRPTSGVSIVSALRDLFASRIFLALSLSFFGCGVTMAFIDVHMVAHFQDIFLAPPQVAVFLLGMMSNFAGVLMFSISFGFSYMGTVIGTSTYTLNAFTKETRGLALGSIWMIHQLGAFLSTQLGANSFDVFGSYHLVITIVGIFSMLSAVISLMILPATPENLKNNPSG